MPDQEQMTQAELSVGINKPPAWWGERDRAARARRTFSIDEINDMDALPERLAVDELKDYGMVNLAHTTNKKTKPWLRAGFYKFLEGGRLWVIEVSSTVVKGNEPPVWILKPIIRVRAGSRNRVMNRIPADLSIPIGLRRSLA